MGGGIEDNRGFKFDFDIILDPERAPKDISQRILQFLHPDRQIQSLEMIQKYKLRDLVCMIIQDKLLKNYDMSKIDLTPEEVKKLSKNVTYKTL